MYTYTYTHTHAVTEVHDQLITETEKQNQLKEGWFERLKLWEQFVMPGCSTDVFRQKHLDSEVCWSSLTTDGWMDGWIDRQIEGQIVQK